MILVDPRTGQHFDGPDENAAEAQKQFGLVTPEAYAQQQGASQLQTEHGGTAEQIGTAFDQGLRSAAAPLGGIAAPEDVDALGNPTGLSPVPSSPDVLARAAANPNAALVGKLVGSAPAYGALGAAAAATGGAAAAGLGASSALGAAAGLATESAATGTLQAAQEGDLSAWNVAKNGLVNFALGGILPVAGALHRAAFGGSALEQAVQSTIERAGAAGENLSDPVIADAYRSRVQGKIDDTVSKIGDAVDSARPPVASNRQAQNDALEQLGESLRNDSPLVADAVDSARALPRDQRYKALLELANETEAPETQQALGDVIQDRSLWGDAAVDHGIAVQAAKDARYGDPPALANAARGIKDDGVQRLVLDLDSHLQDSARLDAVQAFGVQAPGQASTVGAAHSSFTDTDYDTAIKDISDGKYKNTGLLSKEAPGLRNMAAKSFSNSLDATEGMLNDDLSSLTKYSDYEEGAKQWTPENIDQQDTWLAERTRGLQDAKARIDAANASGRYPLKGLGSKAAEIIDSGLKRLEGEASASPVNLAGHDLESLNALPLDGASDRARVDALKANESFAKTGKVTANDAAHGITVVQDGDQLVLRDGRHRFAAAQELGRDSVYGRVVDGETGKVTFEGEIPLKPGSGAAPLEPGQRMAAIDNLKKRLQNLVVQAGKHSAAIDQQSRQFLMGIIEPQQEALRLGLEDASLFGERLASLQKDTNAAWKSLLNAKSVIGDALTERGAQVYNVTGPAANPREANQAAVLNMMAHPEGGGSKLKKALSDVLEGYDALAAAREQHGFNKLDKLDSFRSDVENMRKQYNFSAVLRQAEHEAPSGEHASGGAHLAANIGLHGAEAIARAHGLPFGQMARNMGVMGKLAKYIDKSVKPALGFKPSALVESAANPVDRVLANHLHGFRGLDEIKQSDFSRRILGEKTRDALRSLGAPVAGVAAVAGATALGGTANAAENPDQAHAAYLAKAAQDDTVATARAMSDPAYAAEYARRTAGNPSTLEQFQGEHETIQQAFIEKRDAVQRMLRDPDAVIDALGNSLGGLAPGLRDDLGAHAMKVATYLQAELPPQRGVSVTRPNGLPPSSLEARTYALKYQTALDPSTAFDDAKRGTLRHEQVDTLKVVSPELYDGLRAETLNAMANGQSSIVQRQRADLLFDFGSALDPAFSPALSAAASQARLAQANAAPGPSSAPDKTRIPGALAPDGIQSLTATGARAS